MTDIVQIDEVPKGTETIDPNMPEIGRWFWVKDVENSKTSWDYAGIVDEEFPILCCVRHIGSNYALVVFPTTEKWTNTSFKQRIHFRDWSLKTRRAEQAEVDYVISRNRALREGRHRYLMSEVEAAVKQLGVTPQNVAIEPNANALTVISETPNVEDTKNGLINLRDVFIPAKTKEIEANSIELARWLNAPIMGLSSIHKDIKSVIDGQLFSIGLYAGFNENYCEFRSGDPAPMDEPLHIFQRKLYMDEECLLDYDSGGMDFKSMDEFDEWISKDVNFYRIFPKPKCIVALQVRRERKKYSPYLDPYVRMSYDIQNTSTYLYVRNGDRLSWLETDLRFGEYIIPEDSHNMMMGDLMFNEGNLDVVTRQFWEEATKNHDTLVNGYAEWEKKKEIADEAQKEMERIEAEAKGEKVSSWFSSDYPDYVFYDEYRLSTKMMDYVPLNPDSVYFDDAWAVLTKQDKEHNKVALVLQGIIDRTEMLTPFPRAKMWNPEDFGSKIILVRDGQYTINHGEPPDIEAFLQDLQDKIGLGTVVAGQNGSYFDNLYERHVEKYGDGPRSRYFDTYGNDGPDDPAPITEWKPRAKKAVWKWTRRPRSGYKYGSSRPEDQIGVSCTTHVSELKNYSDYVVGSYKQFFEDPRTRKDYLKWAGYLLSAEEWHNNQRNTPYV